MADRTSKSVPVEPFGWLAAAQGKLGQVETPIGRARLHGVSTSLGTNG